MEDRIDVWQDAYETMKPAKKREIHNGPWTPSRVKTLKKLWSEGYSASQIAGQMGGVTRSGVIGKVHRLKLQRSNSILTPQQRRVPRVRALPAKKKRPADFTVRPPTVKSEPLPKAQQTDIARIRTEDLEPHHCRFGVGDPQEKDFGFCGETIVPGQSYCPSHLSRCHQPANPIPMRSASFFRRNDSVASRVAKQTSQEQKKHELA